jgi:hypothetical protein
MALERVPADIRRCADISHQHFFRLRLDAMLLCDGCLSSRSVELTASVVLYLLIA